MEGSQESPSENLALLETEAYRQRGFLAVPENQPESTVTFDDIMNLQKNTVRADIEGGRRSARCAQARRTPAVAAGLRVHAFCAGQHRITARDRIVRPDLNARGLRESCGSTVVCVGGQRATLGR
jgi:hypothetical protein